VRVSFVMQTASRAGYGLLTALQGTTLALQRAGCEVGVVAGRDAYSERDQASWLPVPVHNVPLLGPNTLGIAPTFAWWLSHQPRPDVVSLHGAWNAMNWTALRRARRIGASSLLTPQGMLDPWALAHSRWKKKLVGALHANRVLRGVDCFHVFSAAEADAVRALGLRAPIAVVPNGVDLPTLGEPAGSGKTLLFLGRLHAKKGISELIEAWNVAAAEHGDWRLVVAGPDEVGLLAELRARVRLPSVDFVGEVHGATKARLLASCDAFILPSRSEGFPMTVLEAWSYARPVLMSTACNIPEGFQVGAALRCEPNVESIAHGLSKLFCTPAAELRTMGEAGRALVERQYTWDRVAEQLLSLYGWLRGELSRPAFVQEL
jgi:glycosyltransferase involved in cell wall biosynthesis